MIVEAVGGAWGPSAQKVFYELAKNHSVVSGERTNDILGQWYQHFGIILHRENARAIMRRRPVHNSGAAQAVIAAAAASRDV